MIIPQIAPFVNRLFEIRGDFFSPYLSGFVRCLVSVKLYQSSPILNKILRSLLRISTFSMENSLKPHKKLKILVIIPSFVGFSLRFLPELSKLQAVSPDFSGFLRFFSSEFAYFMAFLCSSGDKSQSITSPRSIRLSSSSISWISSSVMPNLRQASILLSTATISPPWILYHRMAKLSRGKWGISPPFLSAYILEISPTLFHGSGDKGLHTVQTEQGSHTLVGDFLGQSLDLLHQFGDSKPLTFMLTQEVQNQLAQTTVSDLLGGFLGGAVLLAQKFNLMCQLLSQHPGSDFHRLLLTAHRYGTNAHHSIGGHGVQPLHASTENDRLRNLLLNISCHSINSFLVFGIFLSLYVPIISQAF